MGGNAGDGNMFLLYGEAVTSSGSVSILTPSIPMRLFQAAGEVAYTLIGERPSCGRPTSPITEAQRIVVVRLDALGDVVLTGPLLRELRQSAPQAWITLIVSPMAKNFVETCPYVNEVLTYGIKYGASRPVILARHATALAKIVRHLWGRRFDLAIVPRWGVDTHHAGLIAYMSGAHWRAGYSQDAHSDQGWALAGQDKLYTHVPRYVQAGPQRSKGDGSGTCHEVVRNLDMLRFLGGSVHRDNLECWITQEDEAATDRSLQADGVAVGEPLIAFCLGAGSRHRLWPTERFAEVGTWIYREFGWRVVLTGGPGEEPLGRAVTERFGEVSPPIDRIGRHTLRQTAALLKRCQAYVGHDTGTMHLAAAVGVPCVEISCHSRAGDPRHANSPIRFHPWGVPFRVAQPEYPTLPCAGHCAAKDPHCILSVTTKQVTDLLAGLFPVKTSGVRCCTPL